MTYAGYPFGGQLDICTVEHVKDNEYRQHRFANLVEMLDRWGWTETEDKASCRLWSPIILKEGATRRCKESVEAVTMLVLDYDKGVTLHEATSKTDAAWMAHTSHSHTEEAPRFRLVVPLSEPVPAELWDGFWREVTADLFPGVDQACKDPCRIYYLPCRRPGLRYGEWWEVYSDPCDLLEPRERMDPITGEVYSSYERGPLEVGVYLVAAKHAKEAAGLRRVPAITQRLDAPRGERPDWTRFDPRAWASSMGLKTMDGTARLWVQCPWSANHTDPSKDGMKDAYFRLDESPHWFGCSHSHCADKRLRHIMEDLGGEAFCR